MIPVLYQENGTTTAIFNFEQFPDSAGYPVPLNQTLTTRVVVFLLLSINLALGLKIRAKVIKNLQSADLRKSPINYFFWLDQINGGFLGLSIIFTLLVILLPFPISNIIGFELCNWADLFGSFYLSGSSFWSCGIALLRQKI